MVRWRSRTWSVVPAVAVWSKGARVSTTMPPPVVAACCFALAAE